MLAAGCTPAAKPPETASAAKPAAVCDLKAATASAAETAMAGCSAKWIDANVRINQLQSVGTHNSYKVKIHDVEMASFELQYFEADDREPDLA